MTIREDVLVTTRAFAACLAEGDQAVVDHLVSMGYSQLRAEILLVFVPLGLARSVIARLPVSEPIQLPGEAIILDSNGRQYNVNLLDVPEFLAALELGEEAFRTGIISREEFSASSQSVELNLVNQMLNAGTEVGGAVFSPSILLRIADAPGFTDWYHRLAVHY